MALAKVKTEKERARLDAIFAEIEAMERGEIPQKANSRTPAQVAEDNRKAKIDRLANLDLKAFIGNVKANIGNNAFNTKWENILSKFIVERMAPLNEELNILRHFALSVCNNHDHFAELVKKDPGNYNHYKSFFDRVAKLTEHL